MASTDVVNQQLLNAPLPQLVKGLAESIADAQYHMDRNATEIFKLMADAEEHGITLPGEDSPRSMIALGFTPSFLHFSQATIEAKVVFSMMKSSETSVSASASFTGFVGIGIMSVAVSASYTQKYSFEAEGSSSIVARVNSVPPPAVLEALIRKSAGLEESAS
jgi:hypothetical protein